MSKQYLSWRENAFNQNEEKINSGTYYAPGGQPYKSMQTLWYNHHFTQPMALSLLFMNLGQEGGVEGDAKTRYMQTFGFHFSAQPTNWDVAASFYYQTGKTISKLDVSAVQELMGHSSLKYTLVYLRAADEEKKKALNNLPKIEI